MTVVASPVLHAQNASWHCLGVDWLWSMIVCGSSRISCGKRFIIVQRSGKTTNCCTQARGERCTLNELSMVIKLSVVVCKRDFFLVALDFLASKGSNSSQSHNDVAFG